MISLNQYLFESTFSTDNYVHKGAYDYPQEVIAKILAGEDLKLGSHGTEGTIKASEFDTDKLTDILNDITNTSYKDFNDACNVPNIWSKLYKGDFSGYNNPNKNKGNAFEKEFISNFFSKYKEDLEKCLGHKIDVKGELVNAGVNNTKRPLTLKDGELFPEPYDINKVGSYVTDVTIETTDGQLYLSLKWGSQVTFINIGINNKDTMPVEAFKTSDPSKFGEKGKYIIDMFGIDDKKFIDIFNTYDSSNKKSSKDIVDITDKVNKEGKLIEFIKHIIGCGFILVHQQQNGYTHFYNLLTEKDLNKFVGDSIKHCEIKYPTKGSAKRLDIECELENITIKFNLRHKDGGLYPSHLLSDYTFKKH